MAAVRRRALLAAAVGTVAAACARDLGRPSPAASARPAATSTALPDLAANPGLAYWPDVVARAPVAVREAYAFAVANEPTLQWIPCYCGCGAQGHQSNFDCYVQEVRAGGWIVLDAHGLG